MKKICFAIAAFCSALSVNISHADSEILRNDLTGHLYQRFDKSLSWESSKMDCQKRGGYLATVTSADENDFLSSNFIKDKNPGGIWLGGSNDRSGAWEWVTGEVWEFNNWNEGEPNNVGGTVKGGSEHYLVMGHFPGRGKWKTSTPIIMVC
jgi:hypothetical protein